MAAKSVPVGMGPSFRETRAEAALEVRGHCLRQGWKRILQMGQVAERGGQPLPPPLLHTLSHLGSPCGLMCIHFLGNHLDLRNKESLAPLLGTGTLSLWARSGSQEAVKLVQPLVSDAKSWAPLINAQLFPTGQVLGTPTSLQTETCIVCPSGWAGDVLCRRACQGTRTKKAGLPAASGLRSACSSSLWPSGLDLQESCPHPNSTPPPAPPPSVSPWPFLLPLN